MARSFANDQVILDYRFMVTKEIFKIFLCFKKKKGGDKGKELKKPSVYLGCAVIVAYILS